MDGTRKLHLSQYKIICVGFHRKNVHREYRRKGEQKGQGNFDREQQSGTRRNAAITHRLIGKEGPDAEGEAEVHAGKKGGPAMYKSDLRKLA